MATSVGKTDYSTARALRRSIMFWASLQSHPHVPIWVYQEDFVAMNPHLQLQSMAYPMRFTRPSKQQIPRWDPLLTWWFVTPSVTSTLDEPRIACERHLDRISVSCPRTQLHNATHLSRVFKILILFQSVESTLVHVNLYISIVSYTDNLSCWKSQLWYDAVVACRACTRSSQRSQAHLRNRWS